MFNDGYRQCDVDEVVKFRLVLNATSVLLAYQSDWGLLVSAPGKCQGWSEEMITKSVGQLSCVSEICSLFHFHAVALTSCTCLIVDLLIFITFIPCLFFI